MASVRWRVFIFIIYMTGMVRTQIYVNEINLPGKNKNLMKNTSTSSATKKDNIPLSSSQSRTISTNEKLICPGNNTALPLFTLPCERDTDCALLGAKLLCCERKEVRFKRCLKGLPAPKPEPPHTPWLRIFPRKCPESPIAEFREIKNCTTDDDCTPRICCPEQGSSENYCRTAAIEFDNYPNVKRFVEPVTNLMSYVQCTPPPSPVLDLFVRECTSALDCLPNLCCQEKGRRVCRPPRQSLLSLFIGLTRRIATSSTQMTNNVINSIRN